MTSSNGSYRKSKSSPATTNSRSETGWRPDRLISSPAAGSMWHAGEASPLGVSTFFSDFSLVHALYVGQAALPANLYVLPQKASPLASRYRRGNLPLCYLALGRFHPADSTATAVGRQKRLPHNSIRWPGLPRLGPRSGQGCFRTGLAAGCPNRACGGRCPPAWRDRKAFLSAPSVGDHAQSCAYTAAA